MRAAPAVQMPSRGGGVWRAAQAALSSLAAAAVAAWAASWVGLAGGMQMMLALAAAAAAAGARARAAPQGPRTVGWDGERWWLELPGGPRLSGRIAPALDFGGWMLVRFEPENARPVSWLPLARRNAPAAWSAWRAAVGMARAADPAAAP